MHSLPRVRIVLPSALLLLWCFGCLHTVAAAARLETQNEHLDSDRIKHVIVLMLENRAFDHMFGWFPGVDGLSGFEYNLYNVSDPSSERIFVSGDAPYANNCDPDHSLPATSYKIFGPDEFASGNLSTPSMSGFVMQEWSQDNFNATVSYCNVMQGFTPERVPVISSLASEFAIMDRFFASVPGPTWPNRAFMLSATSSGLTETGVWYQNQSSGVLLPSRTIYDQVAEAGGSWKHYYNDTPWELFLRSVAHHPEHVMPTKQLWQDARDGTLPDFAFINPRCGVNETTGEGSNDDHPDHDVAFGEQYIKDVYEALRASPQWNETLLIVTFDEHGGFYDHVPPPMVDIPAPDNIASYPDSGFAFNRLGMRIPTILVSPWIPRGTVVSSPPAAQKPTPSSEYDLTSIIATTRKLLSILNGTAPLTKRDAWAATFEHVLSIEMSAPRTDCPMHLPSAPLPSRHIAAESVLPVNALQQDIIAAHEHALGSTFSAASHIQKQGSVSAWLQSRLQTHRHRTAAWKQSKVVTSRALAVKLIPLKAPHIVELWNVSVSEKGVAVISCLVGNESYCLTSADPTYTSPVAVSLCYPSAVAGANSDPQQQWVFDTASSAVMPLLDSSRCLTSLYYSDSVHEVYLTPCTQPSVPQSWGYNGTAAGQLSADHGPGALFFWGPMALALVEV